MFLSTLAILVVLLTVVELYAENVVPGVVISQYIGGRNEKIFDSGGLDDACVDPTGTFFIVTLQGPLFYKFDIATGVGTSWFTSIGQLSSPNGCGFDPAGNFFTVDFRAYVALRATAASVSSSGAISIIAGSLYSRDTQDSIEGANARFDEPNGMSFDPLTQYGYVAERVSTIT